MTLRRRRDEGAAPGRVPVREETAPARVAVDDGVNVVGFLKAELGIGEAARLLLAAIREAGIPHRAIVRTSGTASRQQHPFDGDAAAGPAYGTNIICLNPPELRAFARDAGLRFFERRYSVGFWWWEASHFPEELHGAFAFVDEIWVGSEFVAEAIERETDRPVLTMPVPIVPPAGRGRPRAELGLPNGFLFLFVFDFLSVFERKNPLAVVEAFSRAFEPGEGPSLVVKSVNGELRPRELAELHAAAAGRPDVWIVDRYVSNDEKDAMIASCDCYVSLHRSEGFGLTLAEAIACGKPVIATGYSGNLAFMDEGNSYLVGYGMTTIPPGCDPYPAGAQWADPDVDEAAATMRRVHADPEESAAVGRRGRDDVLASHSVEAAAAFVSDRLSAIQELREATSSSVTWRNLLRLNDSVERAVEQLSSPPPSSTRRWAGPPIRSLRRLLHGAAGPAAVAAAVAEPLRELVAFQLEQIKRLEALEARLRELERRPEP